MNFELRAGRLIPPKSRALTGHVTVRDGSQVWFESALERDLIIRLDFERAGRVLKSQPFTLEFDFGRRRRHYTPDLLVEYAPNERRPLEVIEVKFEVDLQDQLEENIPKFEAMRAYCASQSWDFIVLTERHIRADSRVENATFLRRYINAEHDRSHAAQLCSTLTQLKTATAENLLFHAFPEPADRPTALWALWALVAAGAITFDWTQPLLMKSTRLSLSTATDRVWSTGDSEALA